MTQNDALPTSKTKRRTRNTYRYSGQKGTIAERRRTALGDGRKLLSRKLREAREKRGISQRVLAKMLDCTQSRIARAEADGEVDFVLLELWAEALSVPIAELLTQRVSLVTHPDFAPNEAFFDGRSLVEWSVLAKRPSHSMIGTKGFYAFTQRYYRTYGHGQPGEAKYAFLMQQAGLRQIELLPDNAPRGVHAQRVARRTAMLEKLKQSS